MKEVFSRQVPLQGEEGEACLRKACVLIAGTGGLDIIPHHAPCNASTEKALTTGGLIPIAIHPLLKKPAAIGKLAISTPGIIMG